MTNDGRDGGKTGAISLWSLETTSLVVFFVPFLARESCDIDCGVIFDSFDFPDGSDRGGGSMGITGFNARRPFVDIARFTKFWLVDDDCFPLETPVKIK